MDETVCRLEGDEAREFLKYALIESEEKKELKDDLEYYKLFMNR